MIRFAARRLVPWLAAIAVSGAATAQGAEPAEPPAPPASTPSPDAEATAPTSAAPSAPEELDDSLMEEGDGAASPDETAPPATAPAPAEPAAPATQAPAAGQPPTVPPPWGGYPYPPPAAPAPSGPAPEASVEVEDVEVPAPRYLPHWFTAELGLRALLVHHDGFEPFTNQDVSVLGQFVVAGSVTPLKLDPVWISIVPEYDVGAVSHDVRGQPSSLTLHRLAAGVRVDVNIIRQFHVYGRVAPAAVFLHGSIQDEAMEDRPLVSNGWTWGLDATAGIAVLMGAVGDRDDPAVGFWLLAEYGYMFAGKKTLSYAPAEDDDDPRRFGSIDLPAIRPGGVVNRMALALSF